MRKVLLGILLAGMLFALPAMALAESPGDPAVQCWSKPPSDCDPVPGASSSGGITPVVFPGNPRCEDVGDCGNSLKIECTKMGWPCCDCIVQDGTYTTADGELVVTIDVYSDRRYFEWTSNIPVCSVIVKGGNQGANVYTYDGATGDGSLHAPPNLYHKFWDPCHVGEMPQISHIIFCYEEPVPPVPGFPTLTLISTGLVGLGGFAWFRLRRPKHTEA